MGDPVQSLSKTVHPEVAGPKLQQNQETHMTKSLPAFKLTTKQGHERFHQQGSPLPFDLLACWRWAWSDVLSNSVRGVIAEYIVGQAVGIPASSVREEWAPYDLETPGGIRIEVKSSAYIQSWHQTGLSPIEFRFPKTKAWDRETGHEDPTPRRRADVYVFAVLHHRDQDTLDLFDLSQWSFYVVPTAEVNAIGQKTIRLDPLVKRTHATRVSYHELLAAVTQAAGRSRRT